MRKLNGKDLIKCARLVKRLEVNEEIIRIANSMSNGSFTKNQEQLGATLLFTVIGNIGTEEAEKCLWDFLSSPLEMTPEEVSELELLELGQAVNDLIALENPEEWKSFFRQLVSLVKKK